MHALAFIALALAALFTPGWFFMCLAILYLWYYTGYELFIITIPIDIYFGTGGFIAGAWYTLMFAILLVVMSLLKPNLSFRS